MLNRARTLSVDEAAKALGTKPRVVRYYLEKSLLKGSLISNDSGETEWRVYPTASMLIKLEQDRRDTECSSADGTVKDWQQVAIQQSARANELQRQIDSLQNELLIVHSLHTQQTAEHLQLVETELARLRAQLEDHAQLKLQVRELESEREHTFKLLADSSDLKRDMLSLQAAISSSQRKGWFNVAH